ncbi:Bug family tripartite tricarboxylate transporter substrate binding protein [Natronolimnohabitans innermongolicus]|uniref:Extra-cytoplasmic solute receptor n=1 Tax=Natronolimnohabitans innermongolicus JCM 12255 TaxID=1227499 RepID=L9XBB5_9EURY|nr:tripartite tricarboxylate transporter substrate binding protein [Natronolimnohabitans innermongolicus]ELY59014.1 hypothetical protein C493_05170 [Natronolimnohabitans innermongolicus JCM 12255]
MHDASRGSERAVSRRSLLSSAGVGGLVGVAGCLDALESEPGDFPTRQIEIVSPWAAGGSADQTSRAIADVAEAHTETSWSVVNETGGTGLVGMASVARSARPDGHTIGVIAGEITMFDHLGLADLGPEDVRQLIQYTETPAAVAVHEDSSFETIDDLVDYADDNSGELQIGNSGTGSTWHLCAGGFELEADIDVQHVPYDGAETAIQNTVNEEVDATTVGAPEVAPQVHDGPLRALGVMSDERHDALPETEPLSELGYDLELGSWLAGFVPPETPDTVYDSLLEVYNAVYEDEAFESFMQSNDYAMVRRGPDELADFMDDQYETYGEIIDELGI